jgi:PST family polysaccharide transporter
VVAWALTDWLRDMSVTPLVLVLDVGCVAAIQYFLLVWLLPSLFLGPDGRSVLRVLGSVAPGWLRQRDAE